MRRVLAIAYLCLALPLTSVVHGAVITSADSAAGPLSTLYPFRSTLEASDDFLAGGTTSGSIGSLGWSASGPITRLDGGHNPGVIALQTGAVIGSLTHISLGSTPFNASLAHTITFRANVATVDANTTVRYGETDNWASNPPDRGIYFERRDGGSNWFCVARNAGVETRVDSGVSVSTAFANLSYTRSLEGVTWSIHGFPVCGTIETHVPTLGVGFGAQVITSAAAAKQVSIDYVGFRFTDISR